MIRATKKSQGQDNFSHTLFLGFAVGTLSQIEILTAADTHTVTKFQQMKNIS